MGSSPFNWYWTFPSLSSPNSHNIPSLLLKSILVFISQVKSFNTVSPINSNFKLFIELTLDLVVPEYTEDKVNLTFLPIIEYIPKVISPNEDNTVLFDTIKSLKVSPSEMKVGTPFMLHSFPPFTE